jgi:hypothetical protein
MIVSGVYAPAGYQLTGTLLSDSRRNDTHGAAGHSMADTDERSGFLHTTDGLPEQFPTHQHDPAFWEALGRTVATFGLLELGLGKAIFALSGTKLVTETDVKAAIGKWKTKLEKAATDTLGARIKSYEAELRSHPEAAVEGLDDLISDLNDVARLRNALCHGSWLPPDGDGKSKLQFVDRKLETFPTPIDIAFLDELRRKVVFLTVAVMNTVTHMGYQFPGADGPGVPIWPKTQ